MNRDTIENMFTHHPPTGDQSERYERINEACRKLALVIIENAGSSATAKNAITQVQLARMMANSAIAIEGVGAEKKE